MGVSLLKILALAALASLVACTSKGSGGGGGPPPVHAIVTYSLPNGVAGPNALASSASTMWFVTSPTSTKTAAVGSIGVNGAPVTLYYGGKQPGLRNDSIGFFGIAAAPDGSFWFGEPANSQIARITTSGSVTEMYAGGKLPFDFTAGPDGAMWYTLNGSAAIGRVTTGTPPVLSVYVIPSLAPGGTNVEAIAAGADGNLYFTDCGADRGGIDAIGQVFLASQVSIVELRVPTQHSCPQGIVGLSDGSVWFLESDTSSGVYKLARLTVASPFTSSQIVEFKMPAAPGKLAFLTVTADQTLWTANNGASSIAHVTHLPALNSSNPPAFTTISLNQEPVPIAAGPDGNVWFGTPAKGVLAKYLYAAP